MCIEQNFGPHIAQNSADLKYSAGSASSCSSRARAGSSESWNCSFQSNANRARDSASSRWRAPARPRAMSAACGDLVGDHALAHLLGVGEAEVLLTGHVT